MKRTLSTALLAVFTVLQGVCTDIAECYSAAEKNYPLIAQYGIIDRMEELTLENISKAWLPQATVSAKASWQTETTKIPIDFTQMGITGIDIPSMSKDQYGITLDVAQTIWDGGATRAASDVAKAANSVRRQNIEVTTYALHAKVNQLYFGILLADNYLKLNDALLADLDVMIKRVESCIKQGVANQSDVAALKVEAVKANQQRAVYTNNRKAYIEMLATLTGLELTDSSVFDVPEYAKTSADIKRPELTLFDARLRSAEASTATLKSDLMPRFSAFATGGFGRPGLNMFDKSFSPYAIIGVRGTWNIGALYTNENKKKLIEADISSIEAERETFLFNTEIDLRQTDHVAQSWRDQLLYDDEIIELQQSIVTSDEAKLSAGTITGTDLARDMNALHIARQNKMLHETQLLLNSYQRKFITN